MSHTSPPHLTADANEQGELAGLVGEFETVVDVYNAAERVRQAGYRKWDVHSPFPIHGIDAAIGVRPTILPWVVLGFGVTGLLVGLLLAWYTNAVDYPFLISGKPIFSLPANIPVIFETTILLSAFAAVFGMLLLNRLPLLYNPLFRLRRFRRVTNDRFFVMIDARDPRFDLQHSAELLKDAGASAVEEVRD